MSVRSDLDSTRIASNLSNNEDEDDYGIEDYKESDDSRYSSSRGHIRRVDEVYDVGMPAASGDTQYLDTLRQLQHRPTEEEPRLGRSRETDNDSLNSTEVGLAHNHEATSVTSSSNLSSYFYDDLPPAARKPTIGNKEEPVLSSYSDEYKDDVLSYSIVSGQPNRFSFLSNTSTSSSVRRTRKSSRKEMSLEHPQNRYSFVSSVSSSLLNSYTPERRASSTGNNKDQLAVYNVLYEDIVNGDGSIRSSDGDNLPLRTSSHVHDGVETDRESSIGDAKSSDDHNGKQVGNTLANFDKGDDNNTDSFHQDRKSTNSPASNVVEDPEEENEDANSSGIAISTAVNVDESLDEYKEETIASVPKEEKAKGKESASTALAVFFGSSLSLNENLKNAEKPAEQLLPYTSEKNDVEKHKQITSNKDDSEEKKLPTKPAEQQKATDHPKQEWGFWNLLGGGSKPGSRNNLHSPDDEVVKSERDDLKPAETATKEEQDGAISPNNEVSAVFQPEDTYTKSAKEEAEKPAEQLLPYTLGKNDVEEQKQITSKDDDSEEKKLPAKSAEQQEATNNPKQEWGFWNLLGGGSQSGSRNNLHNLDDDIAKSERDDLKPAETATKEEQDGATFPNNEVSAVFQPEDTYTKSAEEEASIDKKENWKLWNFLAGTAESKEANYQEENEGDDQGGGCVDYNSEDWDEIGYKGGIQLEPILAKPQSKDPQERDTATNESTKNLAKRKTPLEKNKNIDDERPALINDAKKNIMGNRKRDERQPGVKNVFKRESNITGKIFDHPLAESDRHQHITSEDKDYNERASLVKDAEKNSTRNRKRDEGSLDVKNIFKRESNIIKVLDHPLAGNDRHHDIPLKEDDHNDNANGDDDLDNLTELQLDLETQRNEDKAGESLRNNDNDLESGRVYHDDYDKMEQPATHKVEDALVVGQEETSNDDNRDVLLHETDNHSDADNNLDGDDFHDGSSYDEEGEMQTTPAVAKGLKMKTIAGGEWGSDGLGLLQFEETNAVNDEEEPLTKFAEDETIDDNYRDWSLWNVLGGSAIQSEVKDYDESEKKDQRKEEICNNENDSDNGRGDRKEMQNVPSSTEDDHQNLKHGYSSAKENLRNNESDALQFRNEGKELNENNLPTSATDEATITDSKHAGRLLTGGNENVFRSEEECYDDDVTYPQDEGHYYDEYNSDAICSVGNFYNDGNSNYDEPSYKVETQLAPSETDAEKTGVPDVDSGVEETVEELDEKEISTEPAHAETADDGNNFWNLWNPLGGGDAPSEERSCNENEDGTNECDKRVDGDERATQDTSSPTCHYPKDSQGGKSDTECPSLNDGTDAIRPENDSKGAGKNKLPDKAAKETSGYDLDHDEKLLTGSNENVLHSYSDDEDHFQDGSRNEHNVDAHPVDVFYNNNDQDDAVEVQTASSGVDATKNDAASGGISFTRPISEYYLGAKQSGELANKSDEKDTPTEPEEEKVADKKGGETFWNYWGSSARSEDDEYDDDYDGEYDDDYDNEVNDNRNEDIQFEIEDKKFSKNELLSKAAEEKAIYDLDQNKGMLAPGDKNSVRREEEYGNKGGFTPQDRRRYSNDAFVGDNRHSDENSGDDDRLGKTKILAAPPGAVAAKNGRPMGHSTNDYLDTNRFGDLAKVSDENDVLTELAKEEVLADEEKRSGVFWSYSEDLFGPEEGEYGDDVINGSVDEAQREEKVEEISKNRPWSKAAKKQTTVDLEQAGRLITEEEKMPVQFEEVYLSDDNDLSQDGNYPHQDMYDGAHSANEDYGYGKKSEVQAAPLEPNTGKKDFADTNSGFPTDYDQNSSQIEDTTNKSDEKESPNEFAGEAATENKRGGRSPWNIGEGAAQSEENNYYGINEIGRYDYHDDNEVDDDDEEVEYLLNQTPVKSQPSPLNKNIKATDDYTAKKDNDDHAGQNLRKQQTFFFDAREGYGSDEMDDVAYYEANENDDTTGALFDDSPADDKFQNSAVGELDVKPEQVVLTNLEEQDTDSDLKTLLSHDAAEVRNAGNGNSGLRKGRNEKQWIANQNQKDYGKMASGSSMKPRYDEEKENGYYGGESNNFNQQSSNTGLSLGNGGLTLPHGSDSRNSEEDQPFYLTGAPLVSNNVEGGLSNVRPNASKVVSKKEWTSGYADDEDDDEEIGLVSNSPSWQDYSDELSPSQKRFMDLQNGSSNLASIESQATSNKNQVTSNKSQKNILDSTDEEIGKNNDIYTPNLVTSHTAATDDDDDDEDDKQDEEKETQKLTANATKEKLGSVKKTSRPSAPSDTRIFNVLIYTASFILAGILGAVFALGVAYAVRKNKADNSVPSSSPSMPTASPISVPEKERRDAIMSTVRSISGDGAIFNTSSPQYAAQQWIMLDDPMQTSSSDPLFAQRYTSATIYYSLDESSRRNEGQPWSRCGYNSSTSSCPSEAERQLSGGSECEWYGYACDQFGEIYDISLNSNGLRGSIPSEISQLTKLIRIAMFRNNLMSTLPTEIGALTAMQRFQLNDNDMSGTIPSEVGLLTDLQIFGISGNRLSGPLPDELFHPLLTVVNIGDNQFTGSIPSALYTNSQNLVELDIHRNKFTGTVDTKVGNLQSLRSVNIGENTFQGSLPGAIFNAGMTNFNSEMNLLTGTLPQEVLDSTSLTSLRLSFNYFNGTASDLFGNLLALTSLQLWANRLTGSIPTEMGKLTNLKDLTLSYNYLRGTMPSEVCALRNQSLEILTSDCNGTNAAVACNCCSKCDSGYT